MNNYKLAEAVLACIVLCSLFALNCSKDDSPTASQNDMALVGDWEVSLMRSIEEGDTIIIDKSELDSLGRIWNFKINSDMTIELITNIFGPLATIPGTWETSGNQLSMTLTAPDGETDTLVFTYAVDGNLMSLNWQDPPGTENYAEFTRQ